MQYTKFLLAVLALCALVNQAYASMAYSTTTKEIVVAVTGVGAGATCDSPKFKAGDTTVTVSWSNITVAPAKIAVKLCYTSDQIVDRAWRKKKDGINDNNQCKQTADVRKFLVSAFDSTALSGSTDVKIPMNTAPTTYTIQVLAIDAAGVYSAWGDSLTTECKYTIESYDRRPLSLQGTMGFFMAFSVIFAGGVWMYDVKKQNSIASQWAQ